METRTVPARVVNHDDVNIETFERALSGVAGVVCASLALRSDRWPQLAALTLSSFYLLRRALTGHSPLYSEKRASLVTTTALAVPHQSSVTIQGSLEEVESYLIDEAPSTVQLSYSSRASGSQIEVRAQSLTDDDIKLRSLLRRAKQMIETGEIARADDRVRGGS